MGTTVTNNQPPPPPPPPPPSQNVAPPSTGGVSSTSATSTPTIINASGSLNTNSQLYVDLYNSQIDKANVDKLIGTPNANAADIKNWQDFYENDINKYKNDLTFVSQNYNKDGQQTDQKWAADQLKNFTSSYGPASLFVDPKVTQGPLKRVSAGDFPGGTQDDHTGVFDHDLTKGYIKPPDISPSSNVADVYNNLTDDQAGYLGWAIRQGVDNKEVYLPDGADGSDLQKWNALATYASQNNAKLKTTGNPYDADDSGVHPEADVDTKVYSGYWYNRQQDAGTVFLSGLQALGQALDPVAPVANAIGGKAGEIVDIVGGVLTAAIPGVGEERLAGLGLGAGTKAAGLAAKEGGHLPTGTIDETTGLGVRKEGPDMSGPEGGTGAGSAAGTAHLGDKDYLNDASAQPKLWGDGPLSPVMTDISHQPFAKLFGSDGPKAGDVQQGSYGNCYSLAAMQNLAERNPKIIQDAIKPMTDAKGNTYYAVTLDKGAYDTTLAKLRGETPPKIEGDGKITINVDGQLPFDRGSFPSISGDAFWPGILDKAFAKLGDYEGGQFGSLDKNAEPKDGYQAVSGGDSRLVDAILTGNTNVSKGTFVNAKDGDAWYNQLDQNDKVTPTDSGGLWSQLLSCFGGGGKPLPDASNGAFFGIAGNGDDTQALKLTDVNGHDTALYKSHAYTITSVQTDASGKKTVTLLNPHNKNPGSPDDGGYVTLNWDDLVNIDRGYLTVANT